MEKKLEFVYQKGIDISSDEKAAIENSFYNDYKGRIDEIIKNNGYVQVFPAINDPNGHRYETIISFRRASQ